MNLLREVWKEKERSRKERKRLRRHRRAHSFFSFSFFFFFIYRKRDEDVIRDGSTALKAPNGRRQRRGRWRRDNRPRLEVRRGARKAGRRDGGVDRIRVAKDALVLGSKWQVGQRPDRQLDLQIERKKKKEMFIILSSASLQLPSSFGLIKSGLYYYYCWRGEIRW